MSEAQSEPSGGDERWAQEASALVASKAGLIVNPSEWSVWHATPNVDAGYEEGAAHASVTIEGVMVTVIWPNYGAPEAAIYASEGVPGRELTSENFAQAKIDAG